MLYRYLIVIVVAVSVVSCQNQQSTLSRIPGGKTAAGILASSANGVSQYFAQDGPIQPAITAISGVPSRATEQLNRGITRLSSGMANQAQSLSQAAGQNGQYRMPGLDTAESHMPESFASIGQQAHKLIQQKNQFIMRQADKGIQASNNLGKMMHRSMSVRSSGPMDSMSSLMEGPANMINSAQKFMMKSASDIHSQARQHLDSAMSRMGNMQGMGKNVMGQVEGISRTVQNGVQGAFGQLQQTGEQVMSQLQNNHQKNMKSMSGMLGSFQGSMGKMNANMQKNMDGVMQHAQNTAHQLTEGVHKAAEAPMKVLSSLSEGLGSMMKGMGGSGSSSGGRY